MVEYATTATLFCGLSVIKVRSASLVAVSRLSMSSHILLDKSSTNTVSVGTLVTSVMSAAEPKAESPTRKSALVSLSIVTLLPISPLKVTSLPISPLKVTSSSDTVLSVQIRPISLVERVSPPKTSSHVVSVEVSAETELLFLHLDRPSPSPPLGITPPA